MPEPTFPRPTTRDVAIWVDLRATLEHVRLAEFHLGFLAEFHLGFLAEKPRELDFAAVRLQLSDARALLGAVALAHAENIEARS